MEKTKNTPFQQAHNMDTNVDINEDMVMDESAYEMYHQAQTNAPCLSFDVIPDDLGQNRTQFPHTCFLVSGTQADVASANHVIVMKMNNLKRTFKESKEDKKKKRADDSDDSSESEDEDEKPELETVLIKHNGCVNRIRVTAIEEKRYAATWSELGKVYIWDLSAPLVALNDQKAMSDYIRRDVQLPLFQFNGHLSEGFAMDWSPVNRGQLATGDCTKNIHVWSALDGQTAWNVDQRPFVGHTSSVEDIQWSPNEASVFASCSTDKSIRVWDMRAAPSKANMISCEQAHNGDVNVISWNKNEPFIVSGGDDAYIKIWDLRLFQQNKPVGILKHHTRPITSIEWNVNDATVFAATSEDNQLTIWDLAVEKDDDEIMEGGGNDEAAKKPTTDSNNNTSEDTETPLPTVETPVVMDPYDLMVQNLPPQLLFIHQGQKEMKELHWHPQIPGVIISTAHTGFNIFKTISV